MVDSKKIILNHTFSPSLDDIEVIASITLESLPEELQEFTDNIVLVVEDFPEDNLMTELDLESEFDLLVFFKNGKELSPGVEKKVSSEEDKLYIYRRPVLDVWCEGGEDLSAFIRQVIIEELGRAFDFSDDEIDEMSERYVQMAC